MNYEERAKELNRVRAKKYYDLHKEEIAATRKSKRLEIKNLLKKAKEQELQQSVEATPITAATQETPITAPKQATKNTPVITTQEAVKKAMETTTYYTQDATRRTNLQQIPLIFRATNGQALGESIKNPEKLIKAIKELKQLNGKDKGKAYSLSASPRILGAVLSIIKFMNIPRTDEQDKILFDGFRTAKLEYDIELYKKKHPLLNKQTAVKRYDKIIDQIKDKNSITYLVANLYKYGPVRNDYSNILLIKNVSEIEPNKNYIVLPDNGDAKAVIQNHKTKKTSGVLRIEYPLEITNLIRKYVKSMKIKYGTKLFKDLKPVLQQITNDNTKDIQDGGTRSIRRSLASSLYDDYIKGKVTVNDIYKQIRAMGHSVALHFSNYIYGVI